MRDGELNVDDYFMIKRLLQAGTEETVQPGQTA